MTNISEENAKRICKRFKLVSRTGYDCKYEYLFEGKHNHLFIEVKYSSGLYILTVRGSLHKFYHGNNTGIFTGMEVLAAKEAVIELFQIEPAQCQILNLEAGANIPVYFPVYEYLKSNLLYHKKQRPLQLEQRKRFGLIFSHEDYHLKFYPKGSMLRFEVRYTSIKRLSGYGIDTLADIIPERINAFVSTLLPEWNEIIMRDGLNIYDEEGRTDGLTDKERKSLLEYTSPMYIQSYDEKVKGADKKGKDKLRQELYRLKNKCIQIIKRYGNGDQDRLGILITEIVKDFKTSWGLCHEFPLDKIAENVTIGTGGDNKGEEGDNHHTYKLSYNKEDTSITGKGYGLNIKNTDRLKYKLNKMMQLKSKKQIYRDRLNDRNNQYNRFMDELKVTLDKLRFNNTVQMKVDERGKLAA